MQVCCSCYLIKFFSQHFLHLRIFCFSIKMRLWCERKSKQMKWTNFCILLFFFCWIWKLICQEKHEWCNFFVTFRRSVHKYSHNFGITQIKAKLSGVLAWSLFSFAQCKIANEIKINKTKGTFYASAPSSSHNLSNILSRTQLFTLALSLSIHS